MTQLPTPPASRQSSEVPDAKLKQLHIDDRASHSTQALDELLEKYLHLLDKHQTLQDELASRLSKGFLSLAHANYTCPPGRRYGADYYDERMKASRRVTLQTPSSSSDADDNIKTEALSQTNKSARPTFTIGTVATSDDEEQTEAGDNPEPSIQKARDSGPEPSKQSEDDSSVVTNTDHSSSPATSEVNSETDSKPEPVKRKPRTPDPIRWYGILVPPSLRSAQKSFIEAVESSLPELASTVVEMQTTEKEISRLRTELGRQ
ncbi:uncharacterized protein BDV14DRAFT_195557 [Aspergillus stella-maris]|uniref:uncharacterized protein n=1 Tax=Aspergillus stella-maris TaxID=1810926 RepID=UPI003CCCEAF5